MDGLSVAAVDSSDQQGDEANSSSAARRVKALFMYILRDLMVFQFKLIIIDGIRLEYPNRLFNYFLDAGYSIDLRRGVAQTQMSIVCTILERQTRKVTALKHNGAAEY
jgi:hypothetical protein